MRFEREARSLAHLSQPNILGIFAFGCATRSVPWRPRGLTRRRVAG
jgi:hypothetical protein